MPVRKQLNHQTPSWVRESDEAFFVTVCCAERGRDSLMRVGEELIESVRFRNERSLWWCSSFVVMPDHVHGLFSFGSDNLIESAIRNWKAWTARFLGIDWQRDWFDHRLRSDESWSEKARYIQENPVRAGLVEAPRDWPFSFEASRW